MRAGRRVQDHGPIPLHVPGYADNYLASNAPASSFETDRKNFLGDNEYGTFQSPLSLRSPELRKVNSLRADKHFRAPASLGTLNPARPAASLHSWAQAYNLEEARPGIENFRRPDAVEDELAKMKAFWDEYLSALQVETPDPSMNAMLNIHNPHQCYVTKTWSRYLFVFINFGLGARGIGVRDSSQDVMAVFASVPAEGQDFLRTLLSFQKRDGSALHQFNPLTLEGSIGDSAEMEDHRIITATIHLWGILAVSAFIKETGDLAFLDEGIPFMIRINKAAFWRATAFLSI